MQAQGATHSAVDRLVHNFLRKLYSLEDPFLRYAIELLICFITVKMILLTFNCASCEFSDEHLHYPALHVINLRPQPLQFYQRTHFCDANEL